MYSILHVYSFVIRTSDVGGGREYSSLYTEEGGGGADTFLASQFTFPFLH